MNLMMNLSELEIGKDAVIESVDCSEISLRKHILDMGLTPGTEISYKRGVLYLNIDTLYGRFFKAKFLIN